MGMTIHERLKAARRDAGYASAAAAAKEYGWPIGTYSCHENGSRGIKLDVAERYAWAFGVNPLWLLRGENQLAIDERRAREAIERIRQIGAASEKPDPAAAASEQFLRSVEGEAETDIYTRMLAIETYAQHEFGFGYDAIPLAEDAELSTDPQSVKVVRLAAIAGGGSDAIGEDVIGHAWFSREWMESQNIDPANCAVLTVNGVSMWPILPDRFSILVDRSRTQREPERIFVFRTPDGLIVKRIIEHSKGNWWLWNDNPAWKPERCPHDADIFGQIVWAGPTVLKGGVLFDFGA